MKLVEITEQLNLNANIGEKMALVLIANLISTFYV